MSDLARTDALTGIRNKLAYDQEATILQRELDEGKTEFGIAIVDLNDLKKTNDLYGHDCGDVSLRQLSMITCTTFEHSPVFRIGGDEFAIILRGEDYQHIEELVETLEKRIRALQETDPSKLKPWERISAAIGYAIFDAKLDANVSAVFRRADEHMYENKKQMKGEAGIR
jgi:diguanylate cyclase (GGDEF)-like protein